MNRLKLTVLRMLCLPMDLVGMLLLWLVTLGSDPLWMWRGTVLLVRPKEGSWLARAWPYSTTLGHSILLHPHSDDLVMQHEMVHARQSEAACVAWWVITLIAWSPRLALLSPFAWLAIYGSSCVAAWLARREAYLGSVFEEHARADTENM